MANEIARARMRMSRFLVTDAVRARMERLNIDPGEFAADILEAYGRTEEVARLDETEVFAIMEMAAKLGLTGDPDAARLTADGGRAKLTVDFSALHALVKRVCPPAVQDGCVAQI